MLKAQQEVRQLDPIRVRDVSLVVPEVEVENRHEPLSKDGGEFTYSAAIRYSDSDQSTSRSAKYRDNPSSRGGSVTPRAVARARIGMVVSS